MNARERFLAIMRFKKPDRGMLWEFGYWGGTLNRWYQEGLPKKYGLARIPQRGESVCSEGLHWPMVQWEKDILRDRDVHECLKLDEGCKLVPVNSWIFPPFEKRIIDEDKERIVVLAEDGTKRLERKDLSSTPQFLEWPIKEKCDWEKLKTKRFQLSVEDRLPKNWDILASEYSNREYPLIIGGEPCGFFGSLRMLMGDVNLMLAYYDRPKFVKEIMNFLTEFWINLWTEVLSRIDVDCARFWEDMAYKNGPLISPKIFREFMLPCYKRITSFLKSRGVNVIHVDSDGDVKELIPLFLESGATGLYPFEVKSGMNVVQVRQKYPNLQILGGIDKQVVVQGEDKISQELQNKLPFMLQSGGYIPFLDHLVPPDVSWNNFVYYRKKVKRVSDRVSRC